LILGLNKKSASLSDFLLEMQKIQKFNILQKELNEILNDNNKNIPQQNLINDPNSNKDSLIFFNKNSDSQILVQDFIPCCNIGFKSFRFGS